MTADISKPQTTADSMKRALEAKKAARGQGSVVGGVDARTLEKSMQRQAVAMNKPAFKRASKRG